mgnify:FL=1
MSNLSKRIGKEYLCTVLGPVISEVAMISTSLEVRTTLSSLLARQLTSRWCGAQVDRLRAPPGTDVTGNTKRLAHLTKQLLSNIYGSIHCFPLYAEMRLGRIPSDVA